MKTPQQSYPKLAALLGVPEVYFKREDLNMYGSHKGRSIPLMIKKYAKEGIRHFVISSSGNAALAAVMAVEQHNKNNPEKNIRLTVFVGKNINENKLRKIKDQITDNRAEVTVNQVELPKQAAFLAEKEDPENTKNLRQSTDDLALEGYVSLAEELNKIPNLRAIFIPTSSGTTAQAIGHNFHILNQDPQIHVVQTAACHPIAEALVHHSAQRGEQKQQSIASAIVDRVAHRKEAVVEIVHDSNGMGWIVNDQEIKEAIDLVKKTCRLDISPNSALSVAGLKKALNNGWSSIDPVVCVITGP